MKSTYLTFFYTLILLSVFSVKAEKIDTLKTSKGIVQIQPILHGSLILTYENTTIYVDPYGGKQLYENKKSPDIILITDIHGDHLNTNTLDSIDTSKAIFIAPQAVADKISEKFKSKVTILNNGQGIHRSGIYFNALPMYNLPEESESKHPKGRGNGYVLTIDNKQIYISGDTEDIPEMRNLRNIDVAFICMNLPFTMDIYQAADVVLEFQPKVVYPYHYRGTDGLSNIMEFKNIVNSKNREIEVRLVDWYPTN
jgi:L-ascorbate metabolism protein UlaG (beta-lactamase superfamily)